MKKHLAEKTVCPFRGKYCATDACTLWRYKKIKDEHGAITVIKTEGYCGAGGRDD